jgi:hypothetical protein
MTIEKFFPRYIFDPRRDSYGQKQAHPSTAKEGNSDPEAVFPLID